MIKKHHHFVTKDLWLFITREYYDFVLLSSAPWRKNPIGCLQKKWKKNVFKILTFMIQFGRKTI